MVEQPVPATLEDFEPVAERGASEMPLVLSEAQRDGEEAGGRPPVAEAKRLGSARTNDVLGRLPALDAPPEDTADFKKRGDSKPPPRKGETVKTE